MQFLSVADWPQPYACTYEVWNHPYTREPRIHAQDFCELFWIESGLGYHHLNGTARPMDPGYFALIRKDDCHGFSARREGERVSLINFAFKPELWEQLRERFFPGTPCFFDLPAPANREYQLTIDERERFRLMGIDLAAGRWTGTNAAAFLLGALALLANHTQPRDQRPGTPDWLTRAARAIESWPHFVDGVPEFVRLAGRSHAHVSRDCRRWLGATPRELVNRARLKWASMQLETTPKEIVQIAQECGFENLGHFYKLFRQEHQTTPRQYRLKFGIPQYP